MSGDHSKFNEFKVCHPLLRARDWQDRPELDSVRQWWESGGRGVTALIGMGGAGKTALADRFLQLITNRYTNSSSDPTPQMHRPRFMFVFSFYEAPNADTFFFSLGTWIHDFGNARFGSLPVGAKQISLAYHQIIDHLGRARRVDTGARESEWLLVLDGLEKLQDDGARTTVLGSLQDKRLVDLLERTADGYLSGVSVLITSRFPLAQLEERRCDHYTPIAVDEISSIAAVSLLRQRGVRGHEFQLEHIATDCGHHALTVDLAGGYIAEFGGGDPISRLQLTRFEDAEAARRAEPTSARRRNVRLQEYRFARIATGYRDAIRDSDPAALALLERVCLFRLGIDGPTITALFTGNNEEIARISGPELAKLSSSDVQGILDRLVALKLLEESSVSGKSSSTYTVHPAVRDGFLSYLDGESVRQGHEVVKKGLMAKLGAQPGGFPVDNDVLDLLEEIIHHAIASGRSDEAWEVYTTRMGGLHNLHDRLGASHRGDRICRAFSRGKAPQTSDAYDYNELTGLELEDHDELVRHWGVYCHALGDLVSAENCLEVIVYIFEHYYKVSSRLQCDLAEIRLWRGRLDKVVEMVTIEIDGAFDEENEDAPWLLYSLGGLAHVLRGDLAEGAAYTSAAHEAIQDRSPALGATSHAEYLIRVGRLNTARQYVQRTLDGYTFVGDRARFLIYLADIARVSRDFAGADRLLSDASEWALSQDARELLCQSTIVRSRNEIDQVLRCGSNARGDLGDGFERAWRAVSDGLQIARNCGFSLHHIDLLLAEAQLHLLEGDHTAAQDDIRLALDDGRPPTSETGQPELFAARHEGCEYAWAVAAGMQLMAEALLLQAAYEYSQDSFVPTDISELPPDVRSSIERARQLLHDALKRWHELRDPEPMEGNNFVDADTGNEYNYKAVDTYRVLVDLEGGILTRYPVEFAEVKEEVLMNGSTSPRVFISYTHDSDDHAKRVLDLSNRLRADGVETHIDQYIQNPAEGWPMWMHKEIDAADFVLIVSTERYAEKAQEPKRSGGRFESVVVLQYLYDAGMINHRYIPVIFNSDHTQHILKWVKQVNHYDVSTTIGYSSLLRRLLDDPLIVAPPVGTPVKKGPAP